MDQAFDWVTARAKCNIAELFGKLRAVVDSDIKSAEKIGIAACFEGHATDRFTVKLYDRSFPELYEWRTFFLGNSKIEVRGPGDPDDNLILEARADLHGADCMLDVNGHGRIRLWEFSRLALEPLLFRGQ